MNPERVAFTNSKAFALPSLFTRRESHTIRQLHKIIVEQRLFGSHEAVYFNSYLIKYMDQLSSGLGCWPLCVADQFFDEIKST